MKVERDTQRDIGLGKCLTSLREGKGNVWRDKKRRYVLESEEEKDNEEGGRGRIEGGSFFRIHIFSLCFLSYCVSRTLR